MAVDTQERTDAEAEQAAADPARAEDRRGRQRAGSGGPLRGLRLRLRLLLRRWRQSLQFRAVSIALIGALLVFLVTGSFLSHQIAERLFDDRLSQALAQSEADFDQAQASFDASDAGDSEQLQTLVSSTLNGLDASSPTEGSQWVLLPIETQGGRAELPAQTESPAVRPDVVPDQLRSQVAESAGADNGVYWQSSSWPVPGETGDQPIVVFGKAVEPRAGSTYGLFLVYDFSQPQRTLDAMHAVLLMATGVQTLLVCALVWYVTREVVRPVSYTARASESLAEGNLGVRMDIEGSHEVARLARSFNRMADNLEEKITRLEELSEMQRTFVSDVSHELRTPLTTVRMAAEVLHNAREEFDPVNRRSAELLHHQVDRFDQLLADLLEISRFDAGAAHLDISAVDIVSLLQEAMEAVLPLAARSGTIVRLHASADRTSVQMDRRRVQRIVRNLLVNALEHGEGEPVDIVVGVSSRAVGIAVRDHGIGMTAEQTAKVFDRFWRADPARTRTTGGTGLGLSIAAEDTRLHGGHLDAWGAPGEGACFRLTLPLMQSSPLAEDDASPVGLPPDESGTVLAVVVDSSLTVLPLQGQRRTDSMEMLVAPPAEAEPEPEAESRRPRRAEAQDDDLPVSGMLLGGAAAVQDLPVGALEPQHPVDDDDLDVSYEELFPDDTGELPIFRDSRPSEQQEDRHEPGSPS